MIRNFFFFFFISYFANGEEKIQIQSLPIEQIDKQQIENQPLESLEDEDEDTENESRSLIKPALVGSILTLSFFLYRQSWMKHIEALKKISQPETPVTQPESETEEPQESSPQDTQEEEGETETEEGEGEGEGEGAEGEEDEDENPRFSNSKLLSQLLICQKTDVARLEKELVEQDRQIQKLLAILENSKQKDLDVGGEEEEEEGMTTAMPAGMSTRKKKPSHNTFNKLSSELLKERLKCQAAIREKEELQETLTRFRTQHNTLLEQNTRLQRQLEESQIRYEKLQKTVSSKDQE